MKFIELRSDLRNQNKIIVFSLNNFSHRSGTVNAYFWHAHIFEYDIEQVSTENNESKQIEKALDKKNYVEKLNEDFHFVDVLEIDKYDAMRLNSLV